MAMADTEADNLLTKASNQFTARMFSEVVKSNPGKSVVMSAYSVMPPLAQLSQASVGESHDEILSTIGMPNDKVTKEVFSQLDKNLKSSKDIELRMANKIYLAKNFELNKDFAIVSRDVFNSEVKNLDFSKQEESAKEINAWVEDQTNHKIKDLVDPSILTPETLALLVNAIYFKGKWLVPFNRGATRDEDFYLSKGKTVKVPMMYVSDNFKYAESEELDAQLLELSYEGNEASMIVILPNKMDGISSLEEKLKDPIVLENAYKNMTDIEMEVNLPRFKIETTTDLKDMLQKMNLKKLFVAGQARLDNLIKDAPELYISNALQKAFIEVNEEGAEAAAGNVFGVAYLSAILPSVVFNANHPFVFLLKHNGKIMFNGAYHA